MAQAVASSTDELLSQLAASEIDRLLAEADGNPAPEIDDEKVSKEAASALAASLPDTDTDTPAADSASTTTNGSERAALLQAAGFESAETPSAKDVPPQEPAAKDPAPVENERSAVLHAAGFESPGDLGYGSKEALNDTFEENDSEPLPFYLKPLEWINAPLASSPAIVRQMLGTVGVVTLINAIAVLTYVFFFRKR